MQRYITVPRQSQAGNGFLMYAYMLFCSYALLTGIPFLSRDLGTITDRVDTFEQGNAFRQVFYITFLLLTTYFVSKIAGWQVLRTYPVAMCLLLLYGVISLSWSAVIPLATRRLAVGIIFVIILFNFCALLGVANSVRLLGRCFTVLILLSLVSVVVVPGLAKHPDTELDPQLVGMWRGMFAHKNHAAAACALAIIWYCHEFSWRRRWWDAFMIGATLIFLLGSGGKTALGFCFPSVFIGLTFTYFARQGKLAWFAAAGLFLIFIVLPITAIFFRQAIYDVLSDPQAFTGRVAVWQVASEYISDHLWFGSGFGSFWQTGEHSPLEGYQDYWPGSWLEITQHAHNGYIETLLTLGLPGLVIAVIASIVVPMRNIFRSGHTFPQYAGLLLSWLCFAILFNFLEAQIFTRDWQVWLIMIVIATLSKALVQEQEAMNASTRGPTLGPVAGFTGQSSY